MLSSHTMRIRIGVGRTRTRIGGLHPTSHLPTPLSNSLSRRLTSTSTSSPPSYSRLNFDDVTESFAVKSNAEIMRALLVFRLCSSRYLVRNSRTLLNLSDRLLGRSFTAFIMRRTFFGHFCAGENAQQIKPVIAKLEKSGLRAILDYAAESDVAQTATTTATAATPAETSPAATSASSSSSPRREGVVSARTYDYEGEAECDENVKICLSCITSAGAAPDGFAAIKLTALGQPELLEHLSKIIIETNRVFRIFVEHTLKPEEDQTQSAHLAGKIDYDTFAKGLRAINVEMDEEKAHKLFQRMDVDRSGTIDYLEWISFLDPRLLGGLTPKFRSSGLPTLSQSELERLNAMIARLETLAEAASKYHVKLMVDAEQTYFQPAIDHLVLHLQRRYNIEHPIIYNTYQCYLKSAHTRLVVDMERARREKFWFAAKCVRGAYMIQERKRARDMGYQDPIHDTIQDTHANYHLCVDTILKQISRCHVMVATHNEETVKWVTRQMAAYGIADRGAGVYFGQLLGMCDHVSFSLGHVGYAVYKYVPYGPIHEVIPYLIRRAEENSDMLGGVGKERRLLWNELKRRMKSGIGLIK